MDVCMIHILLAANNNYAMPLTVAAHSALRHINRNCPVSLNIVDDGLSETNRRRAASILERAHPRVKIVWHQVDLTKMAHVETRSFSQATFIRLFASELFGDDVDRVLYIDSDVVVESDVSALWDIDLGDKAVWAMQDGDDEDSRTLFEGVRPEGGLPPDAKYFNAGVLLINLPEWRRKRVGERAIELLLTRQPTLRFLDQDALNAITLGDWGRLPARWNKQMGRWKKAGTAPMSERGILHFTADKPWKPTYYHKHSRIFHFAYLRSGWEPTVEALRTVARLIAAQFVTRNKIRLAYRFNIRFD